MDAVHSYTYTPGGTGHECLRINSIEMVGSLRSFFPEVEFGWRIGVDCLRTGREDYPYAFETYNDSDGYHCHGTDRYGNTYPPPYPEWDYYTIASAGGGTWTLTVAGYVFRRPALDATFTSGLPVIMNSERQCDASTCDDTSNWGNLDRLEEETSGTWQPIDSPQGFTGSSPDPDYTYQHDSRTSYGDHFQSVCISPCTNHINF